MAAQPRRPTPSKSKRTTNVTNSAHNFITSCPQPLHLYQHQSTISATSKMSSNTKYTAAPQRDSFDETATYSQAPPSYAEPTASTDHAALLGGVRRTSDDNTPDDFKFIGVVAEAPIDIRMAFVRKVYAILTVQLLATGAMSTVSFFSEGYRNWIQSNAWMMWTSVCTSHFHNISHKCITDFAFIVVWCNSLPAPHLLETQVIPNQPSFPLGLHPSRSLFRLRDSLLLRILHRPQSRSAHRWTLHRSHPHRLPNQI